MRKYFRASLQASPIYSTSLWARLSGEDQDLLHAAVRNDLHLVLDLRHVQLHPLDMVEAVEAAVDTVVFAIGDVQGVKR